MNRYWGLSSNRALQGAFLYRKDKGKNGECYNTALSRKLSFNTQVLFLVLPWKQKLMLSPRVGTFPIFFHCGVYIFCYQPVFELYNSFWFDNSAAHVTTNKICYKSQNHEKWPLLVFLLTLHMFFNTCIRSVAFPRTKRLSLLEILCYNNEACTPTLCHETRIANRWKTPRDR